MGRTRFEIKGNARWLWLLVVAFALVPVVYFASEAPPDDWRGEAEFCEAATAFSVGQHRPSIGDQIVALEVMRDNAPTEVRSEIGSIIDALENRDESVSPDDAESVELGRFIEDRCDLNLPGIT